MCETRPSSDRGPRPRAGCPSLPWSVSSTRGLPLGQSPPCLPPVGSPATVTIARTAAPVAAWSDCDSATTALTFPRLEGLSWPRPRKEERVNGPDRHHRPCGESDRRGSEDDSLLRRDRGITDPDPGGIGLSTVR